MAYRLRDRCKLCEKRKCHLRIFRLSDPVYDEVFCDDHIINGKEIATAFETENKVLLQYIDTSKTRICLKREVYQKKHI